MCNDAFSGNSVLIRLAPAAGSPSVVPAKVVLIVEGEVLIHMFVVDELTDSRLRVVEANADEALLVLAARSEVSVQMTDVNRHCCVGV